MAKLRPNGFRIRITDCGTEQNYGSYSTLRDLNALVLVSGALEQILDGAIPQRLQAQFKRELGEQLIADADGLPQPLDDPNKRAKWYISRFKPRKKNRI